MIIDIFKYASDFAENKDQARYIRTVLIAPALKDNQEIILDFSNVSSATQSFIHALIRQVHWRNF